jgi:hypothetical protein
VTATIEAKVRLNEQGKKLDSREHLAEVIGYQTECVLRKATVIAYMKTAMELGFIDPGESILSLEKLSDANDQDIRSRVHRMHQCKCAESGQSAESDQTAVDPSNPTALAAGTLTSTLLPAATVAASPAPAPVKAFLLGLADDDDLFRLVVTFLGAKSMCRLTMTSTALLAKKDLLRDMHHSAIDLCPICLGVPCFPHQMACGHVACGRCIHTSCRVDICGWREWRCPHVANSEDHACGVVLTSAPRPLLSEAQDVSALFLLDPPQRIARLAANGEPVHAGMLGVFTNFYESPHGLLFVPSRGPFSGLGWPSDFDSDRTIGLSSLVQALPPLRFAGPGFDGGAGYTVTHCPASMNFSGFPLDVDGFYSGTVEEVVAALTDFIQSSPEMISPYDVFLVCETDETDDDDETREQPADLEIRVTDWQHLLRA